jgi:hypothetical protein
MSTSISFFDFPTQNDWERIYQASPFEKMLSRFYDLIAKSDTGNGILAYTKALELRGYIYQTQQRLKDAGMSYILMMFYYEKGIPDKRWYGDEGEVFPDFDERHFYIKRWFDFYSDTSYYKLFSAWDLMGHVLNVKYDLGVNKVDFAKAISKLKHKDITLYTELENVRGSVGFQKAITMRNNITHNQLPNTVGMAVHRSDRRISVGLKEYATSDEVVKTFQEALSLFDATMQSIAR